MELNVIDLNRRAFITKVLAGSAIGFTGFSVLARVAFSMGALARRQGIQKIQGEVKINGIPAEIGALVKTGDVITTGPKSYAVFVIDRSAYLVRDNTRLEFSSETSDQYKEKIVNILRLINGKMLSVFGRRRRKIFTTTAVAGIRGTGIYLEAEPERTYICTCYGLVDIQSKAAPEVKETVKTSYHESPRYVYASGADQLIAKAPVINHTDAELIMLEGLVQRKPPFADEEDEGGNGGY